jgi:hypothetical protein
MNESVKKLIEKLELEIAKIEKDYNYLEASRLMSKETEKILSIAISEKQKLLIGLKKFLKELD